MRILLNLMTLLVLALFLQARFVSYHDLIYQISNYVTGITGGHVNRYGFYLILWRGMFIHWWYILLPLVIYHSITIAFRLAGRYRKKYSLLSGDEEDLYDSEDAPAGLPGILLDSPYDGETWARGKNRKDGRSSDRPEKGEDFDPEVFLSLTRAVSDSLDVVVNYHNRKGEQSVRRITPEHIFKSAGAYYMEGYCHRRGEERTFRLDRIMNMRIMSEGE